MRKLEHVEHFMCSTNCTVDALTVKLGLFSFYFFQQIMNHVSLRPLREAAQRVLLTFVWDFWCLSRALSARF